MAFRVVALCLAATLMACDSVEVDVVPETSSTTTSHEPSSTSPTVPAATTTTSWDTYYQGTRSEYHQDLAGCLAEGGWNVSFVGGQSPGINVPEQIQGPAFDAAWEECKASLPPPPERESEEDFRELYELWIGQYDCLSDAGFVLDERPTFEVWLYRIIYSDEKPIEILWSGHDAATALVGAPEDYLRAISTCAPITDNW